MNKTILIVLAGAILIAGTVYVLGANGRMAENSPNSIANVQNGIVNKQETGKCTEEEVSITGYGDKGKRLSNCFVEYPGEPTRQDKSYYVLEDVCGQFTKEFVQNTLGKPIMKIEPPTHDSLFNCTYQLNEKGDNVILVFEYLSAAIQKKGQEEMGRRVEESNQIPMRNMVVWQDNGLLNTIYLVFDDMKFISIHRSNNSDPTSDELLNFAKNMAQEIKNYK